MGRFSMKETRTKNKNKQNSSQMSSAKKSNKKIYKKKMTNKWNEYEYSNLIKFVRQYGEDWNKISSKLMSKTSK